MKEYHQGENFYQKVYTVVSQIPLGKVMTYGQIARFLGYLHAARAVGYALHLLPHGSSVPWQRVINYQGKISPRSIDFDHATVVQRLLLEAEGVMFDDDDRVDLEKYLWNPE